MGANHQALDVRIQVVLRSRDLCVLLHALGWESLGSGAQVIKGRVYLHCTMGEVWLCFGSSWGLIIDLLILILSAPFGRRQAAAHAAGPSLNFHDSAGMVVLQLPQDLNNLCVPGVVVGPGECKHNGDIRAFLSGFTLW